MIDKTGIKRTIADIAFLFAIYGLIDFSEHFWARVAFSIILLVSLRGVIEYTK